MIKLPVGTIELNIWMDLLKSFVMQHSILFPHHPLLYRQTIPIYFLHEMKMTLVLRIINMRY